jgi:hypothetical protein
MKKMKKVLLSIFTIIIIGLFSSCNSDDDGVLIPVDPISVETDTILQDL